MSPSIASQVFGPRPPRSVVALIAITVFASLAAAIDPELYDRLALIPSRVWHGELWRVASWAVVRTSPLSVVVGCVVIYWFGGELAVEWGDRRLARYLAAVIVIAGAGTTLAGLVSPRAAFYPQLGGIAVSDALVIAWARTFPYRQLRFYGLVDLGGAPLAYGLVALNGMIAVFYGVVPVLPELFACAVALIATSRWWRGRRRRTWRVYSGGRHGGPYGA